MLKKILKSRILWLEVILGIGVFWGLMNVPGIVSRILDFIWGIVFGIGIICTISYSITDDDFLFDNHDADDEGYYEASYEVCDDDDDRER